MAIIGLLLILAAGAVTAGAVYDGSESARFEVFGLSADTTIAGVFGTGLATMLVFMLGMWMLFASMGRSRRKRAERKETRNRQRQSVSQMEQERAELRAENERLNQQLATGGGTAAASRTERSTSRDGTGDTTRTDRTPVTDGDRTDMSRTDQSDRSRSDRTDMSRVDGTSSRTDDHRPEHVEGDRVVDHTTDLRSREETATSGSGRHRDA